MNTNDFRTRTFFLSRKNPSVEGFWGISLDVGYSSVKAYSPNSVLAFPSFSKKIESLEIIGRPGEGDLFYKDETGIYAVGDQAYAQINPNNSSNETNSMYIRDRFANRNFLIISRMGLALSMMKNQYGDPTGKKLHVETGLPPAYMRSDSSILKETLARRHVFSVKRGAADWIDFDFELSVDDIDIMPQPMGTLISIATTDDGKKVPNAKNYFKSKLIIFDPGFGTLDTFCISNNVVSDYLTFDNLGMHRVFTELTKEIEREYSDQIRVYDLQECLKKGVFRHVDKRRHSCTEEDFSGLLEKASRKVCDEALQTLDESYDYLSAMDYLVLTGGTSSAWEPMIKEYYKEMSTLTIVNGTSTSNLPSIFTNVRGYYMMQLDKLKKLAK